MAEINVENILIEILQRVTALETKINGYNDLRNKLNDTYNTAENAIEKIDNHCKNHDKDARQIKAAIIGMIIALLGNIGTIIFATIK